MILSLMQKVNKLSPYNSEAQIYEKELAGATSVGSIKQESNYKEWRKIELHKEVVYRRSSFEEELEKIKEYTTRNESSLEKYLENRKELLRYGLKIGSD